MQEANIVYELFEVLIRALGLGLGVVITIYSPRLFRAIEDKLRVDIPDALEVEAESLAIKAIAFAEEHARKLAREGADKIPHVDKLGWAATWFRLHAKKQVTEWLGDRVEDWILANLGTLRMLNGSSHKPILSLASPWVDAMPEPIPSGVDTTASLA